MFCRRRNNHRSHCHAQCAEQVGAVFHPDYWRVVLSFVDGSGA
jgi:hypothetical protein